jgi:S-adenosylmethionine:tRNA ribosyltransferase-isomerase
MRRTDFFFDLPDALIARQPAAERSASRMLHLDGASGAIHDRRFRDLPSLLRAGDLLVFNDTRVVPARMHGCKRSSGGKVEVLLERRLDERRALVQLKSSKPARPGIEIELHGGVVAHVVERDGEFWCVDFNADPYDVFERHGVTPLPPYIDRPEQSEDRERYQTVYARKPGAVAAPTAGLHFDASTLAACRAAGVESAFVTLHVGAGTFQSVRVEDIAQHRMHAERYDIPAETVAAVEATRRRGGRVVAVGTTAVRSLEAAAGDGTLRAVTHGETRLFITPGATFRVVDAMLTNFHLPESTLLMLVCAFAGREHVLRAYRHAIEAGYRFFSYGDAMFVEPDPTALTPRDAS